MVVQICEASFDSFFALTSAMNEFRTRKKKTKRRKGIHFTQLSLECNSLAEMVITTEVKIQRNGKKSSPYGELSHA